MLGIPMKQSSGLVAVANASWCGALLTSQRDLSRRVPLMDPEMILAPRICWTSAADLEAVTTTRDKNVARRVFTIQHWLQGDKLLCSELMCSIHAVAAPQNLSRCAAKWQVQTTSHLHDSWVQAPNTLNDSG